MGERAGLPRNEDKGDILSLCFSKLEAAEDELETDGDPLEVEWDLRGLSEG